MFLVLEDLIIKRKLVASIEPRVRTEVIYKEGGTSFAPRTGPGSYAPTVTTPDGVTIHTTEGGTLVSKTAYEDVCLRLRQAE